MVSNKIHRVGKGSVLPAVAEGVANAQVGTEANETEPKGALMTRTSVMPADTNPGGTVFGGWLLGRMDTVCSIIGTERAQGLVVTAGVDKMSFLEPITKAMLGQSMPKERAQGAH